MSLHFFIIQKTVRQGTRKQTKNLGEVPPSYVVFLFIFHFSFMFLTRYMFSNKKDGNIENKIKFKNKTNEINKWRRDP